MDEGHGVGRIGQVSMTARDLERAVGFYRDVLGLTFLFQAPPRLAFFDCAGVRLMLSAPEDDEFDHPGSILYFTVPDIDATYATLTRRGVAFRGAPHRIAKLADREVWIAFFGDTERNTLALMCERVVVSAG